MSSMKNGKAVGPDEIPAEVVKALGDSTVDVLHDLANTICETGEIPEILQKSVFITIPKKIGVTECENFRTIAIMSHVIEIFLKICVLRMKNKIHPEISEEQYGFQSDKSTGNAIFFLRILSERAIEMQQDLQVCFIDYKKAFDRLKHEIVLKKPGEVGIDDKDLRIIQNLYYEQEASVRVGNAETETIPITKGVRQGCVASPDLFNLYQEMIMRATTNMAGIKVGGININNIRYADDTALIATSQVNLQRLVARVVVESTAYGMEVNVKKTECMVMTKKESVPERRITIKGEMVKQVKNCKYLGSNITSDGRCVTEVKCRIAQAKRAFVELDNILKNKKMSIRTRMRVLKCYVHPILRYGCEAWTLNAELKRAINAFEMWCLRRMQRISYVTRKTNKEILQQTGQKRELLKNGMNRQLQFFGQVMRKQKLEHVVICGKIRGKRGRGRQRLKFMDQLKDVLGGSTEEILWAVNDRDGWRNKCKEAVKGWPQP